MMSPEQVEVFARGLYHVAHVDGVDDRELALIDEFLQEANAAELAQKLPQSSFHVSELAIFETSFLQKIFLKACLVLVRGDGTISDPERNIVAQISAYLGLDEEFAALDAEAAQESF